MRASSGASNNMHRCAPPKYTSPWMKVVIRQARGQGHAPSHPLSVATSLTLDYSLLLPPPFCSSNG